ncbi:MAG: phospholipase [Acuticoccus sp.]
MAALAAAPARAQTLPPYKDRAFAYPPTITSEFGGDYRLFRYDKRQTLKPPRSGGGQRIGPQFAALRVRRTQRDLVVETSAGPVRHVAVGAREGARLIVVYAHGRGGTRLQGVDDFAASGNFNRIKNLVVDGGGLYLSPDFSTFGEKGAREVGALISHYAAASPGAPVFIACGSMGGAVCYWLAENPAIAARLGGLILLGTYPDETYFESAAFERRVPVLIGQGTEDRVYPVEWMETFFSAIRLAAPGYPVRIVLFDKGTHGSPIRMVDWRETINWMLSAR